LLLEFALRLTNPNRLRFGTKSLLAQSFFFGLETVVFGLKRSQIAGAISPVVLLAPLVQRRNTAGFADRDIIGIGTYS
jgi:hypothetical protein